MSLFPTSETHRTYPLKMAIEKLLANGYRLYPADGIPGLLVVDGPGMIDAELTEMQIIDYAAHI